MVLKLILLNGSQNGTKNGTKMVPKSELVPKSCPEALLEPEMHPTMEPKCIQEPPRGTPRAQNGPQMLQACSYWALLAAQIVVCDPKMVLKSRNCLKFCLLFRMLLDPPKLPALKLEPTDQPTASRGRRDSRRD